MDLLDDSAIERRLADLPGWRREGDEIRRTITARDFPSAIRVVDEVATEAERMNHHPDIDIRWRTLHLALSTHDAGGLTDLDFTLAARIDEIAEPYGRT
ncbi:4a-hydroxytetrahydrobiopterin dehydratase [Streptosporangium saharense]|uniref:Putative pterin-4-alpha-carbinolamine dehydratase n=1 Tax=Streptosporangium saharense TaxID=1706840 RepID=A0A7W7QV27_9ACTN|nr:4a-hydroxytetrahydrobiopterin dehydratase [Streptosporangium saharense]MBB4920048.1 4a-hydroxytetrahydrobiopterin dehydratase [Streptosporangium saharense]